MFLPDTFCCSQYETQISCKYIKQIRLACITNLSLPSGTGARWPVWRARPAGRHPQTTRAGLEKIWDNQDHKYLVSGSKANQDLIILSDKVEKNHDRNILFSFFCIYDLPQFSLLCRVFALFSIWLLSGTFLFCLFRSINALALFPTLVTRAGRPVMRKTMLEWKLHHH